MRKAITALWLILAALLAFGLVLVYSASATQKGGALPFIRMQLIAAFIGFCVSLLLIRVDYRFWRKPAIVVLIWIACIVLASLVFGTEKINGSRRWIKFGGLSLQPSEFTRLGMVLVMAAWYEKVGPKSRTFLKGFLYPGLILAAMVMPVALSPDLGATVVIAISSGTILIAAGVRKRWLFLGVVTLALLGVALVLSSPNKRARMMTYFDNMRGRESSLATEYHRNQSLEAFIIGGATGRGIGQSIQKYQYLPEANTDFIFAIAGEEFGLPATLLVVVAFSIFLYCGVYIAYHAADRFGKFTALGLSVLVAFEAGFNIGMVTGCLPTKGLALPFNSYGGSSLIATFIAFGLIVSIGKTSADEDANRHMRDALQSF